MNDSPARFPEFVNFNPLIGLKAFRTSGAGGAWSIFVLAKNLDENGLGKIERDELKAYTKYLGVSNKQYSRWLTAARNHGMVQDVQNKDGKWMLVLASQKSIAESLACKYRGRVVSLPAKLLLGKGKRAFVFASWQSIRTNNGVKLVSQKKQAEIVGISEQTQRKYNKEAGVQSKRNYAISNIHANGYDAALEFGNRAGLFQYWNNKTHQKYLGWRIPDSRYFPLFGVDGSHKTRRALSLFNRTAEQYAASKDAIRKTEPKLCEMYVFDRVSRNGNSLWIHLPLNRE